MADKHIKTVEKQGENPFAPEHEEQKLKQSAELPKDIPSPEVVKARADVIEETRRRLEDLARRLALPEGFRQEKFVA